MDKAEMKQRWEELYDIMATSNNPKDMMLFGSVMKEMMERDINYDVVFAEQMLAKLCAVKWKNYVTQEEADKLVAKMQPQPGWNRDAWGRQMERMGLVTEEAPYYNRCALYLVMSMKASDCKGSIARLMGKMPPELTMDELTTGTYLLALDALKDADGRFEVRKYFGI